ncbi:hypothetical protein [Afipia clevelandensis]|uniref:Uncharacterized protein n=1 Tax=Afipia clevelandensis ATCC 49720 TaxID=883079 RepID=K8PDY5_9BRAD|nr:hypothetical protein [Afipia clevelandensis]EKS37770.1 hypothetical protein HMPREF9696_01720 [Afipia clevelandensis ATCC 49720]
MGAALVVAVILRFAWVFTVLIGTSYVVFWLGYSGWWFLLAVLLMGTGGGDENKSGAAK